VIVDGMNRFEIASKHGLTYPTERMEFDDYEAVTLWMLERQAGRRNMTPHQLAEIRGKWHNAIKADPAANLDWSERSKGQIGTSIETQEKATLTPPKAAAEVVAEKTGVSARTVKRDAARDEAIQSLPEPLRNGINTALWKAPADVLAKFIKLEPPKQHEAARAVRTGQAATLKDAMVGMASPGAKPKAPVKALEGAEAEAFDARQMIGGMHKTLSHWLSSGTTIDVLRAKYPGRHGDAALAGVSAAYEALRKWEKAIK
jgi:hypothetical protein